MLLGPSPDLLLPLLRMACPTPSHSPNEATSTTAHSTQSNATLSISKTKGAMLWKSCGDMSEEAVVFAARVLAQVRCLLRRHLT